MPVRFSQEQIDANRSQIKIFVVLPIPPHATQVQFETIGRTTFKKYVIKCYEDLFDKGSLKTSDFTNVPFVVSETATAPHVVRVLSQQQQQPPNQSAKPQNTSRTPAIQQQSQSKAPVQQQQASPQPQIWPRIQIPITNQAQSHSQIPIQTPIVAPIPAPVPVPVPNPSATTSNASQMADLTHDSNDGYYKPSHSKRTRIFSMQIHEFHPIFSHFHL